MQHITLISNERLNTRSEELDGIKYLVAPVIMVKEQVLNNEYLPADEIIKSVPGWNGRPVVVYHPKTNEGTDTSANEPSIVKNYEIGKLYNVEYDDNTTKLKGEIWIDISKVKKNKDTRQAYEMIKNSDKLEVSTGYFVNNRIESEGDFDGIHYIAIQREILPDHLALLPDEIGACSWKDGAGVRNNKRIELNLQKEQIMLHETLLNQIKASYPDVNSIEDMYFDINEQSDFVVFRKSYDKRGKKCNKLYKLSYNFDKGTGLITIGDAASAVEPVMQYITKNTEGEDTTLSNKKVTKNALKTAQELSEMTPEELAAEVQTVLDTASSPEQAVSDLNAMAIEVDNVIMDFEDVIDNIASAIEQLGGTPEIMNKDIGTEATNMDVSDIVDPDENPEDEDMLSKKLASAQRVSSRRRVENKEKTPITMDQYINSIPDKDAKEFIINGIKASKEQRAKLIKQITMNKVWTSAELEGFSLVQLEKLTKQTPTTDFSINGMQTLNSQTMFSDESGIPLSVNIFKKGDK